jgi:hypothetical protein
MTLSQTFTNVLSNPLECEYVFPIEASSVVSKLEIIYADGRKLTAKVQEKGRAAE